MTGAAAAAGAGAAAAAGAPAEAAARICHPGEASWSGLAPGRRLRWPSVLARWQLKHTSEGTQVRCGVRCHPKTQEREDPDQLWLDEVFTVQFLNISSKKKNNPN